MKLQKHKDSWAMPGRLIAFLWLAALIPASTLAQSSGADVPPPSDPNEPIADVLPDETDSDVSDIGTNEAESLPSLDTLLDGLGFASDEEGPESVPSEVIAEVDATEDFSLDFLEGTEPAPSTGETEGGEHDFFAASEDEAEGADDASYSANTAQAIAALYDLSDEATDDDGNSLQNGAEAADEAAVADADERIDGVDTVQGSALSADGVFEEAMGDSGADAYAEPIAADVHTGDDEETETAAVQAGEIDSKTGSESAAANLAPPVRISFRDLEVISMPAASVDEASEDAATEGPVDAAEMAVAEAPVTSVNDTKSADAGSSDRADTTVADGDASAEVALAETEPEAFFAGEANDVTESALAESTQSSLSADEFAATEEESALPASEDGEAETATVGSDSAATLSESPIAAVSEESADPDETEGSAAVEAVAGTADEAGVTAGDPVEGAVAEAGERVGDLTRLSFQDLSALLGSGDARKTFEKSGDPFAQTANAVERVSGTDLFNAPEEPAGDVAATESPSEVVDEETGPAAATPTMEMAELSAEEAESMEIFLQEEAETGIQINETVPDQTSFETAQATAESLPPLRDPETPGELPASTPTEEADLFADFPEAPELAPTGRPAYAQARTESGPGSADIGQPRLEYPDFEAASNQSSESREATISVDFPDAEIRTIIRQVADLYELNVVVPPDLVGNTSIKLHNVTWEQVFREVLRPVGYTFIVDENIVRVVSNEELLQEPVDTRVFVINYAQAAELQNSIAPLVDAAAGGRLQVDRRSNALVITERPSRFNNIQEIIQRLDRPTPQVMIESKFIEITDRDQKDIGVNWASLQGYEVSAGPFEREYFNEDVTTLTETNTTGGRRTDAVEIEDDGQGNTTIRTTRTSEDPVGRTVQVIKNAVEGRIDSAVFNADQFGVVLSALKTLDDTRLVSNPTVVTLNNTEAMINIGEEFPIPEYTFNDERGTFEVSGFEYKPIGIILRVTPQVNSAGFINLEIEPEVSNRVAEVNFGGQGGASIPIISTRKTRSDITIKDGFTLAIGGLVEQNFSTQENKVPLLGDIPLAGRLFRHESKSDSRRNLIIFITAKTLNPDGSTYDEIFDPRVLNQLGITDQDVPGYVLSPEEARLIREVRSTREEVAVEAQERQLREQLEALEKAKERARWMAESAEEQETARPELRKR